MSGKKYLLDTNIIIGLFAGDQNILLNIEKSKEIFVPSIVLGELFYGAELSAKKTENLARLEKFAKACNVLSIDLGTAKSYGTIKSKLKTKGQPIPENDVWIAAIAHQHKLCLATRDAHFGFVEFVTVEKW